MACCASDERKWDWLCIWVCCVCEIGGGKSDLEKTRGLRSWSKKKRDRKIHVCLLTHLQRFLCEFMCMLASNCLWSQRKRDLNFRGYALLSRTHTCTGLNIFIMNHDSNAGVKERRHILFKSLLLKVALNKLMLPVCEATQKLDYNQHLLAPILCPLWKWTWASDLSPRPFPVTWLALLWPIMTSLVKGDPAVLRRSGGATANNTLLTFKMRSCWLKPLKHF